ncbi:MAG: TolC family protein, partial [Blastocatellia bacterium]|nr:TolC family protein [Blastocatellia bacterium]
VTSSQERQAELQLRDTEAQVEEDVRLALVTLTAAVEQMRAAEATLNLAERELSMARDRFSAGLGDNIEVVNAQTSLENARNGRVTALAAYNTARVNLAAALGRAQSFRF